MGKRYRSEAEAVRVRTEACHCAIKLLDRYDGDAAELMALCVFFEAFIGRGSRWTQKTMKIMPEERAKLIGLDGGRVH